MSATCIRSDPLDGAAGLGGNLQLLGSPGYGSVFDAPNGNINCRGTGVVGCADFYRRTENSLWYDSSELGGFHVRCLYPAFVLESERSCSSQRNQSERSWSLWARRKYVGPSIPIQVWVAYEHHKDNYGLNVITSTAASATSTSDKALQVGVGYTLGDIFIFGIFEQLKYDADGLAVGLVDEYKRNALTIGAKWNIATGYIGGQYMQAMSASCDISGGAGCNADNTGAKMVGVGYYHTLSKQTQAYVMGSYTHNESLQFYSVAGAGSASGGATLPTDLGANVWGVTVGLKHSF